MRGCQTLTSASFASQDTTVLVQIWPLRPTSAPQATTAWRVQSRTKMAKTTSQISSKRHSLANIPSKALSSQSSAKKALTLVIGFAVTATSARQAFSATALATPGTAALSAPKVTTAYRSSTSKTSTRGSKTQTMPPHIWTIVRSPAPRARTTKLRPAPKQKNASLARPARLARKRASKKTARWLIVSLATSVHLVQRRGTQKTFQSRRLDLVRPEPGVRKE